MAQRLGILATGGSCKVLDNVAIVSSVVFHTKIKRFESAGREELSMFLEEKLPP